MFLVQNIQGHEMHKTSNPSDVTVLEEVTTKTI